MAWDLSYLHLYLGGEDCDSSNSPPFGTEFKGLMEETICLVKGATGWRQDDLEGVFFTHNVSFTSTGAWLSRYDCKVGQRVHSTPIFLPSLAPRFARIDVVVGLRKVHDFIKTNVQRFRLAEIKDKDGNDCKAVPFFTYIRQNEHLALKGGTIGNYFQKCFLNNVKDGPESEPLSNGHSQHSSRHAVASTLNEMGVSPSSISTLTLNSAATLQQTYICLFIAAMHSPKSALKPSPTFR
jgi:hypothetical protein